MNNINTQNTTETKTRKVRTEHKTTANAAKPQKRMAKLTEYALRLREKQACKKMYGMRERQFRNCYEKAKIAKGDTGDMLLQKLENRLDNVVYRLGLANTRNTARQLINHKHFLVNGKAVNIPSYEVSVGDIISIRPRSQNSLVFKNRDKILEKYETPTWLFTDKENRSGKILTSPDINTVKGEINIHLIVEYYSRL